MTKSLVELQRIIADYFENCPDGQWKQAGEMRQLVAQVFDEVAVLTKERALYPSHSTRTGWSCSGVNLEGDSESMKQFKDWHWAATERLPGVQSRIELNKTITRQGIVHALDMYADNYLTMMGKDVDTRVLCQSVSHDIRQNIRDSIFRELSNRGLKLND